jgi:3,4-dihydroxy 2-butanone 4-phosphate synthase / GTP cyclohydrolase II
MGLLMDKFHTIEEAIEEIKNGKMVIVVDDEDRENEGDLLMAAESITAESVTFMARFGRGIICTPLKEEKAKELGLNLMVEKNTSSHETAFTVSIDHVENSTGISSLDRAKTIFSLIDKTTRPEDLIRPGHVFPLIAKSGGVLRRAGHTEAAVDLASLAGMQPVGVICEIIKDDGTMARVDDLVEFSKEHDLKLITIKDLIEYRNKIESQVVETANIEFPSEYGDFRLHMFESKINSNEHHVALVKGDVSTDGPVMVRVHSECLTGDVFGSKRCDCGSQLGKALEMIEKEGRGVLLYMRQEGRGIGLPNKIKAYTLQDKGYDTVDANTELGLSADLRDYGVGAQILKQLGILKINLLTNNPKKIIGLSGFGLEILERIPLEIEANEINRHYLETKRDKMGHILGRLQ